MYKVICQRYRDDFQDELNLWAEEGYRIQEFIGWKGSNWMALMVKED